MHLKKLFCFFTFLWGIVGSASNSFCAEFDIMQELRNISGQFKVYHEGRRYPHQEITRDVKGFVLAVFPPHKEIGVALSPRKRQVHEDIYVIKNVTDIFQKGEPVERKSNDAWRDFFQNPTVFLESTEKTHQIGSWVSYSLSLEKEEYPYFLGVYYEKYDPEA